MKNPTRQELMEFVDGVLTPQRKAEIEYLVRHSTALQNEISLLNAMKKAVQTELTISPSKNFTAEVMKELLPARQETIAYRLLKNSSNIFAMVLVLSLIGIVLLPSPTPSAGTANSLSRSLDSFSSFYDSAIRDLSEWTKQYSQPLGEASKTTSGKIAFIALAIFSLFIAIDEIFGKKRFHAKMKN